MTIDNSQLNNIRDAIKGKFAFDEAMKSDGITYYADYIELFALASNEEVSKIEIVNYFYSGVTQLDDSLRSGCNDSQEAYVQSCLKEIDRRCSVFGCKYPFKFCDNSKNSIVIKEELTCDQVLYLQLLISSKLSLFKNFQANLTTDFEKVSEYVLRGFLPKKAKVLPIGKNSIIKGSAQEKVSRVAEILNGNTKDSKNYILGNQEYGVDIVAHIPFQDDSSNRLVYYCQCSCNNDINRKCSEPMRWLNLIELTNIKAQVIMFFPYNYIGAEGRVLFSANFIGDPLIFERKRIMDYCSGIECQDLLSYQITQRLVLV